jgi:hypothetical protein
MTMIRLRYRIENARRMKEHLHLVDGVGYFFFPNRRATAPSGMLALLEIDFSDSDESTVLRGLVWSRPATGGLWLELPGAARALDRLAQLRSSATLRENRRLGSEELVLVQSEGQPSLLCRLRDLSAGGARLAGAAGEPGDAVTITTTDAEPRVMAGTVVWSTGGISGLAWDRSDAATRKGVVELLQAEGDEWTEARSEQHPASCRCGQRERTHQPLLLLG